MDDRQPDAQVTVTSSHPGPPPVDFGKGSGWTPPQLDQLRSVIGRDAFDKGTIGAHQIKQLQAAGYAVIANPADGGITIHPPGGNRNWRRRVRAAARRVGRPGATKTRRPKASKRRRRK